MKKLSVSVLLIFTCLWVMAQNDLVGYEFWFNNDYSGVNSNTFTASGSHQLDAGIDVSALPDGINVLNVRYKNQTGIYSSTLSKLFYKNTEQLFADKNLTGYEYWFNNDYVNVNRVAVTPSTSNIFVADLDIALLPDGVNIFNIRYIDEKGMYSSTLSKVFLKNSGLRAGGENLAGYQYWFNNDFGGMTEVALSSSPEHTLVADLDISSLPDGVNIFNMRYKNERGVYSSTLSKMFLKYEDHLSSGNNLVGYEYWFNNDYDNACKVSVSPAQENTMVTSVDISSLPEGVNTISIRYRDAKGIYGSTVSKVFFKAGRQISNNKITGYKYWFDDDVENTVFVGNSNEEESIDVDIFIDLSGITKGEHILNMQFRDSLGYFSVIKCDTISKTSLPIAGFEYSAIYADCDSTEILFDNKSIDGDIYLWDFGDGLTDTARNPSHRYYSPGNYPVCLTATDTLSLSDSTFYRTITVTGKTSGDITVFACDSYTSPSGKLVYTSSCITMDTLTNQWGCDSLLTINLTINNTKYKTDVITSCGPYTWIDGITYTESNYSATYVTQTITGCDSIVSLNLTVSQNSTGTDYVTSCGPYTWIDGVTYTENNTTATYVLPNSAGCDSTVTLNLTITEVDNSVAVDGTTITANASGATYQWLDCTDELSAINGETGQSFTAAANGSYAVRVEQNGCADTSACVAITTVGIEENSYQSDIILYPNPTSGRLIIDLNREYPETIVIISDTNGRLISRETFKDLNLLEISINGSSGPYLITIRSGQQQAVFKVIKQ